MSVMRLYQLLCLLPRHSVVANGAGRYFTTEIDYRTTENRSRCTPFVCTESQRAEPRRAYAVVARKESATVIQETYLAKRSGGLSTALRSVKVAFLRDRLWSESCARIISCRLNFVDTP